MVKYKLDPITGATLTLKLYKNVKNMPQLRQLLLNREIECGLINPKMIVDPFQIVIAANKALTSENFTTKSIYTEILFNLSISKNITKSLQQFGITSDSTELLLILVEKDENQELYEKIQGDEIDLDQLQHICDKNLVKKYYKITKIEEDSNDILDSIVSRIVTKNFVSY